MNKYSIGVIASGAIGAACIGLHVLDASSPPGPVVPLTRAQASAREDWTDAGAHTLAATPASSPAALPPRLDASARSTLSNRPLWFPRAAEQRQLAGDPQQRSRPCLCQFGVGLHVELPGLKIGQLVAPGHYGHHSYGGPSLTEQDGQV